MATPFLFVSHVSEDHVAAAELVSELERRSVRCWIAPRDIRPGKPYDDEIAAAIDDCIAMLLIFSERCNESDYIRREITVAGEARKLVIPFRIEDAQPKRGLRVRLADLHWIDGFVAREQAIETLIQSLLTSEAVDRDPGALAHPPNAASAVNVRPAPALSSAPAHTRSDSAAGRGEPGPLHRDDAEQDSTERWSQAAIRTLGLAKQGDRDGQYLLATYYATGREGVTVDKAKAFAWARRAAEQNHGTAQVMLANLYDAGSGVAIDKQQSAAWMMRAATQEVPTAQFAIGCMLREGKVVEHDPEHGIAWLRKAGANSYGPAWYTLGQAFEEGRDVEKSVADAIDCYRKVAYSSGGDAWVKKAAETALQRLGASAAKTPSEPSAKQDSGADGAQLQPGADSLPEMDDSVSTEGWPDEDRRLLQQAQAGDAQSQCRLAGRYQDFKSDPRGKVPQNLMRSVFWATKAAKQDYQPAHAILAYLYTSCTDPGLHDRKKGFHHALKSAESGNQHWQYDVAYFYEKGLGVETNFVEALRWYRVTADAGLLGGQAAVGRFYEQGLGVEPDYDAALEWYRKAAQQESLFQNEGCAALGRFYENGVVVEQDLQQAADWYCRAGRIDDAKTALQRLKEKYGVLPKVPAPRYA